MLGITDSWQDSHLPEVIRQGGGLWYGGQPRLLTHAGHPDMLV